MQGPSTKNKMDNMKGRGIVIFRGPGENRRQSGGPIEKWEEKNEKKLKLPCCSISLQLLKLFNRTHHLDHYIQSVNFCFYKVHLRFPASSEITSERDKSSSPNSLRRRSTVVSNHLGGGLECCFWWRRSHGPCLLRETAADVCWSPCGPELLNL